MQILGEVKDGFAFTGPEIQRASPRFWRGLCKRAAYDRVLECRGLKRHRDEEDGDDTGSEDGHDRPSGTTTGVAALAMAEAEQRHAPGESSGRSWFGAEASDGGHVGSGDSPGVRRRRRPARPPGRSGRHRAPGR